MTAMSGFKPKHFNWRVDGKVAIITLSRPERKNPMTFESYAEIRDTFRALVYADDIKAVVIGSNGGNFCSGGDVHDIIGPLLDKDMKGLLAFTRMTGDLVKAMRACPQPVIAAVDGVCVGAGAMIALFSDMRIGAPQAKAAFLFTRVGLAGCDMGACAMLPRVIGQGRASELLYTGRTMSADEGERWGFYNKLVEAAAIDAEALKLAHQLADGPNFAHMMTKTMLAQEWSMSLDMAIEAEAQAQAICMQTQDFRRAYEAFVAKGKPVLREIDRMPDKTFLDWPFFEPRHRTLAEKLEAWAGDNLKSVDHHDVDAACRALVAKLGDAGFLKHTAPGDTDAEKIDVRTLALTRETLARHSGLADFAFAMQGLGAGPISLFGTPAQRAAWLPKTRAGKAIAAFALSEAASGSDVANITTAARKDGDGYVLDGEKYWISNGGIADLYVVFARTGEAPGARGLSAFIVAGSNPGLSITERIDVIAPHPLARIAFKNCRIDADALIGKAGDGFKIAMATLDVFRTTVGAAALGFARRALDETLKRSAMRNLFGAPLGDLQMVQGHIADMALDIDAASLLVYRAAWTKDQGAARVTREAAMAKLYATEAAQRVIDTAVQIHGGDGVRSGHPVETLYREIRALRIYEGASDVQKVVIARSLQTAEAK